MRKQRAVLSAGGTGGHLFPAQGLAEALPDWEILFVAGGLSTSRYFDRTAFRFEEVSCATFSLKNPLQAVKGAKIICSGIAQSRKILKAFAPDVVVGFGSFFTLPVLAAAKLEGIPFVLHEQNAVTGKVNRLFAPFAHTRAVTFPLSPRESKRSSSTVEVAFPMRKREDTPLESAWDYFGLNQSGNPVLLVFGGSQGAVRLNALVLEAISLVPDVQVLHFTGSEEQAEIARACYLEHHIPACVKPFEPRIDLAMRIATCAVTRAGAATVCELIDHSLPALLVPYPFATENHQEKNGTHFVSRVGGGKMYQENELDGMLLASLITQLLAESSLWKGQIESYKHARQAAEFADVLRRLPL